MAGANFDPTVYNCTDGTSGVGTSFPLTPAAGANITCTFSNTRWATLIIKKNAPNGYNNTTFTYDIIGPNSFSASTTATINNSGSGTAATLQLPTSKTGQLTYDVVEEPKPGWNTTGIVCTGEAYAKVVKLTFARGAALPDPSRLFNSSLAGNRRRAIDLREGEAVDARAFRALVKAAVAQNGQPGKARRGVSDRFTVVHRRATARAARAD